MLDCIIPAALLASGLVRNETRFRSSVPSLPQACWSHCILHRHPSVFRSSATPQTQPLRVELLCARARSMSTRESKRQKKSTSSDEPYELLYWPGIPGRGEPVRLCLEETRTPYKDIANQVKDGINAVLSRIDPDNVGEAGNIPPLAPPMLRQGNLLLSQLPNILLYLGPKLGLVPNSEEDPMGIYFVNQLALTALDGLSNEPHDVHQ